VWIGDPPSHEPADGLQVRAVERLEGIRVRVDAGGPAGRACLHAPTWSFGGHTLQSGGEAMTKRLVRCMLG
jgi:hypothetical protein